MSPARFLTAFTLVVATSLSAVAGVNYYVDPANLFGDRTYEAGVAALLAQGKGVANVTDYDERLVQKFFAERLTARRDVLVLGSSRAMNLVPEYFGSTSFFNASVSGASLEDLSAILQIYRERGLLPRRLVLGVDPWMFNRNSGQTRWKSLEAEYARAVSRGRGDDSAVFDGVGASRAAQLISYAYFRASLQAPDRRDRNFFATDAAELDVNIRRADGTITYRRELAHRGIDEARAWVLKQASQTPVYSLGQFRELDAEDRRQFASLLERLRREGVEVSLFLAPYHPAMYEVLSRADGPYAMVAQAERYVRDVARARNLPLFGSYDPAATGCSAAEFYDEMHPKPSCLDRIVKSRRGPDAGMTDSAAETSRR